jgi:hypothetical protein
MSILLARVLKRAAKQFVAGERGIALGVFTFVVLGTRA